MMILRSASKIKEFVLEEESSADATVMSPFCEPTPTPPVEMVIFDEERPVKISLTDI